MLSSKSILYSVRPQNVKSTLTCCWELNIRDINLIFEHSMPQTFLFDIFKVHYNSSSQFCFISQKVRLVRFWFCPSRIQNVTHGTFKQPEAHVGQPIDLKIQPKVAQTINSIILNFYRNLFSRFWSVTFLYGYFIFLHFCGLISKFAWIQG